MNLIELDCPGTLVRACIRHGNQTEIIPLCDILYCRANGNYTNIYLNNEQHILTSSTLSSLLNKLKHHGFAAIHKNAIVNLQHVRKIKMNGIHKIVLSNGAELEISRRCRQQIQQLFTKTGNPAGIPDA